MNFDFSFPLTPEGKKKIALGIAITAFIVVLIILIFALPSGGNSGTGKATDAVEQIFKPECPEDCSDSNKCTIDYCNSETEYGCKHVDIVSEECGNKCPESCSDNLEYTRDYCSADTGYKCEHEDLRECVSDFCWINENLKETNADKSVLLNEILIVNKEPIKFSKIEDLGHGIYILSFINLLKSATQEVGCGEFGMDCKLGSCELDYLNSTQSVTFKNSEVCKIYT